MRIEHITEVVNKPTERGYISLAYTKRVVTVYQHWSKEAHKANRAKLPTLRILSNIKNIPGAELEHIPTTYPTNHIATSIRIAMNEVDEIRANRRQHILKKPTPQKVRQITPKPMPTT